MKRITLFLALFMAVGITVCAAQTQLKAAEDDSQKVIAGQDEMAQKRNYLDGFTPRAISTTSDLYNLSRKYRYEFAGENDVENIRRTCQELGEQFMCPVIYYVKMYLLKYDSHTRTYDILIKYMNSDGTTGSETLGLKASNSGSMLWGEPIRIRGYLYIVDNHDDDNSRDLPR